MRKVALNQVVAEPDGTLSWSIHEGQESQTTIYFKLPQKDNQLKFKFWSIEILEHDPDIVITGEIMINIMITHAG